MHRLDGALVRNGLTLCSAKDKDATAPGTLWSARFPLSSGQSRTPLHPQTKAPRSRLTPNLLDVEVHTEFERMRAHSQGLNLLLAFVADPAVNQPGGEDIAFEQELVVRLESIQGLIERAR